MNKFVLMLLILNLRESLPIQFSITTKVSSLIRLHKLLIRSLSGADLFSIHIFLSSLASKVLRGCFLCKRKASGNI